MTSSHICARCGLPCLPFHFGWKHCAGWHSKPSCGQRPEPVERVDCERRSIVAALDAAVGWEFGT